MHKPAAQSGCTLGVPARHPPHSVADIAGIVSPKQQQTHNNDDHINSRYTISSLEIQHVGEWRLLSSLMPRLSHMSLSPPAVSNPQQERLEQRHRGRLEKYESRLGGSMGSNRSAVRGINPLTPPNLLQHEIAQVPFLSRQKFYSDSPFADRELQIHRHQCPP